MRLTLSQLKKIINEEVTCTLREAAAVKKQRTPEEQIKFFKENPEKWNHAKDDYENFAWGSDGGPMIDADGEYSTFREVLYSGWTNEMFQQVIDAMEGPIESTNVEALQRLRAIEPKLLDVVKTLNGVLDLEGFRQGPSPMFRAVNSATLGINEILELLEKK
jgi:hypothetical protein